MTIFDRVRQRLIIAMIGKQSVVANIAVVGGVTAHSPCTIRNVQINPDQQDDLDHYEWFTPLKPPRHAVLITGDGPFYISG